MTDHQRFRDLAATSLDFELRPAEAATLLAHTRECSECRHFLADLRADAELLRSMPRRDAPPHVAAVVLSGQRRKDRPRPALLLVAAVGLLGALTIGTLAVGSVLEARRSAPTPRPATLVTPSPLASPDGPSHLAVVTPLSWQRVADQPDFHAPHGIMEAVTAGGPGLVAVGDACASGETSCHAGIWTSKDGSTWTRVPDGPVFDVGAYTPTRRGEMTDVIAGGPGLIAVGRTHGPTDRRAVIWTSTDGTHWTRIPDSAAFARGTIEAITAGGPGYVAVGGEVIGATGHAAVWTSTDGSNWTLVPDAPMLDVGGPGTFDDGRNHGAMVDVVPGGPGLVAVGSVCAPQGGACRAAVWTSVDGTSWSRDPDAPVFDGNMYAVTRWAGGLAAVGDNGKGTRLRAWTSTNGFDWTVSQPISGFDGGFSAVAANGDGIVAAAASRALGTAIYSSADGIHWAMTETPEALGPGAINGLGVTSSGVVAVGWDGKTPAAVVWQGQP
ncbi:MAG: hypothetical protein QOC97_1445 [Chloroflexota bacterium]|nr:hypothetical protein [Chloroflexota bacterium]